jgi:hypothetical protein
VGLPDTGRELAARRRSRPARRITTDEPSEDLADNWLNSMRSRQPPIYDVRKGYQVTVAIQLGVQSYREGRALGYDPKARRVLTRLPARREYPVET